MNSTFDVAQFGRELKTTRYGRTIEHRAETDSTNDDAKRALAEGANSGHTIVADAQRTGRGSRGRVWSSPAGTDLYLSIVERLPVALSDLPPLTLAVGLAVAEAADALLGRSGAEPTISQVKWPNDVLLGEQKCAGVLIETSSTGGQNVDGVIIGIGLNVNREQFPEELRDSATSLLRHRSRLPRAAQTTVPAHIDRQRALCTLLERVETRVDEFVAQGAAHIAHSLAPRLAYLGKRVRCSQLEGVLRGVASSGALLLETPAGLRELVVGPLELLP
jgi:BirA family transcriptional regulator, biotin operon repressor / biotin---[acetyl-CoA-carboxylase] ligase